jgi:hypothetical protein
MRRAFATVLVLLLAVVVPVRSHGDPVVASTLGWTINGIVSEVARSGEVAYVGGSFRTVAPSSNLVFGFAAFSFDSAVPVLPNLNLNDTVEAVVALPGGGWLIGGRFTTVNGVFRNHLARLTADGSLDMTFTASVDDTVSALAVSGATAYLGGAFTMVAGSAHHGLAAINAATGARVSAFMPSVVGGSVRQLLVNGTTIYAAGDFTTVNGASRPNLVALSTADGSTVASFDPSANGPVHRLLLTGTDLFAAGAFASIGGTSRRGIAKLSAVTGAAATTFDAQADGDVNGLALIGTTLYLGGSFANFGINGRQRIGAVNATTGAATAWNPGADGVVKDLAAVGTSLIAVGDFSEIGGVERLAIAMLDTTRATSSTTSWNPSLGNSARVVHADGNGLVFVSGDFRNYGAVRRDNLAAIDLFTGDLLPWNPGTDGWVRALDVFGNVVYIGGDFTRIGGATRDRIAALDAVTGVVAAWNPRPNAPVKSMVTTSMAVYFVGQFTSLTGTGARGRGAAVDHGGTVLPWNPNADDTIETVFVGTDRVFLGGSFGALGGVTRERLGAVDVTSGAVSLTFAPSVNNTVYRLDVQNNLVFFGGVFDMVNGATRNNAAAVRSSTLPAEDGQLAGWDPNVGGPIYDLDAFGASVFLAGGFGSVGGQSRPGIAMVDALAAGGALRAWKPVDVSGGAVSVIDASDTAVMFGGLLNNVNGVGIGAVLYPEATAAGAPKPPTTPDILVRGSSVRFDWQRPPLGAAPSSYIIEGGDGPGRTNLANFSTGNAGTTFSASGLPPGTYYVRMRSSNPRGVGAPSREQAFVVGGVGCASPPTPPLDLRAAVSGNSVTLEWRTPVQSSVDRFRVVVGATSTGSELGTFDVGAVTAYSVSAAAGAYFVRVLAANACGVSAPSAEIAVVVGPVVVPPTAPFGLDAVVSGSTVVLTWARPSVGTGPFQFVLEAGSATGLANLANLVTSQTTYAAAGVPPGIYYVRVRASGPGGIGPAGNEMVVVVP